MKQSPAGEFHPRAHGRRVDGGLPRGCGQGRDGHRLRCSEPPQQPPEGTLPPWLEGAGQEAELGRGLPSEAAAVEGMQPCQPEGKVMGPVYGLLSCPNGPIQSQEKRELSCTVPGS